MITVHTSCKSLSLIAALLICTITICAQPKLSLWRVDEAHLHGDHGEGESYFVACDDEYYIHYDGPGTTEDINMVILNEGDAPLTLTTPLSLSAGSDAEYSITQQPGVSSLDPGEETHFVITYTAPADYVDARADIIIESNDPDNPLCGFGLDVGAAVSALTISKVFTPSTIGPGAVSTITFTITNTGGMPVTDISFTDILPTMPGDVDIASPANASSSCGPMGVLTAPDGGGTISFTDGSLGGGETCTITVDVTASTPGAHTNPIIFLTSSDGGAQSLPIDLTVVTTLPGFSKSFAPSSVPLGDKSRLTFTIDNALNVSPVGNLSFTDNLPIGMVVADPPNATTNCISAGLPDTELIAVAGTNTIILDADGSTIFPGFEVLPIGATCTVGVDVLATGAGMLDNVASDLLADFTSAGKASDVLEVTRTDLAIQKEFTDDPIPAGGTATLVFTLDNFDRNFSATGVGFTDDLTTFVPALAGLTFDSVLSNDCGATVSGAGGTTISVSGGTIAPEGSCTISVSLSVPAGATPGAYTNTTSAVTATVNGSPVVGNMASDDLFVEPVPILTKEFLEVGTLAPDPIINPGDDVVLRFTVTNTSTTSGATDISFIDELTNGGPGTGFLPFPISAVLPGSACGGTIGYVFPDLERQGISVTGGSLTAAPGAGSICTIDVTLTVPADVAPGIYTNTTEEITATVDGSTRIGDPASDDLTIIAAPQLTKTFTDDPVGPGGTVTLEFTLSHSGNATTDATGITFTDDLTFLAGLTANLPPSPDPPCGAGSTLTASAGDTFLTLMGGTLTPGSDCTFSVTLDVPAGAAPGSYTNTTSGVSATVEGLPTTSQAVSDDLDISGLVFTKEFIDDPLIAGETGTLRFTIENIHPTDDATITFFTDNLQNELTGLAATGPPTTNTCGSSVSGSTFLTVTGGSVLSGTSCVIDVPIMVPLGTADGPYVNMTGSLSANQGGAVTIDPARDILEVNSNLIQLDKAFTDDPVAPGDPVTLEFTLTNLDATRMASDVDFTDDLGAALMGLTFDSVLSDDCGGTTSGTGTDMVSVTGASLAAGGSCTVRISATVPGAAAAMGYPNTTSDVTGTIATLPVTGDAASDDLEVIQLLTFSKSFDGPTTATGAATLTFTITNPGVDVASGITFSDDLNAVIPGLIATSLPAVPCGAGSSISGISFLTFTGVELPPLGGTCSFDVDVLVPATATAGTFPNTTSDLFQNGLVVADPATADLTIEPSPTFAKVFGPDAIFAGGTSTLTFTIDNSSSTLAASGLAFTDNLPAGVTITTPSVTSNTCGGTLTATAGTSAISLSGGAVGAGASCTIDVDVTSIVNGMHVNTTGDLMSSSGNSGTASDVLTVTSAADISVTKTDGVTSAVPGQSVTYTIVVANAGPSADPAVTLSDVFPSPPFTATYTSAATGGATGNTAAGAGNLAETLSMPAGSSVTYTVTANIDSDATGTLSNTATVTPSVTDLVPGNNSATDSDTVLEPMADISVAKSDGVTSAIPGQTTLAYTIIVSNSGPSDDPSVSLTDAFPADLTATYTSVAAGGATGNTAVGSGDLSETLSMPTGSSVTYTVMATIDPGATGTLSNTATAAASVTDPTPGNNSATDDDTVLDPMADITVTKSDGVTSAVPGQTTLTYTIEVLNSGPSDDPSVTLSDVLPGDLTASYTSVASGGATGNTAAGSGDLSETLNMPTGSSVTYTVMATIDPGATGTLSNTATATASVTDPTSGNNSATDDDTVLDPMADITVTKSDGATSAVPGQTTLTYTIVVSNSGPSDDPSVTLTDVLPTDLTATYSSVAAGGATGNTTVGSGDLGETLNMPTGSSVTYTVMATIDPGATGTLSNTATATASVTDPMPGNNSATDDDTVLDPMADIFVTKSDGITSIVAGQSIIYTIVVTNNGPSDDPTVAVSDALPADLTGTFTSVAVGGATGNTAAGAGDLAETLNMPTGSSVTYTVTAVVDCDATGTLSNTVTSSSSVTDPVPANNSATDGDTVIDPEPLNANIMGTLTLCEGEPDAIVTFTATGGTAPYTFSYNINGGTPQTITTTMGNSVTLNQSTAIPDTFVYTLTNVEDANMCSQMEVESITIIVDPLPGGLTGIIGPEVTCPGLDGLPFEVTETADVVTYDWTFSDNAVTINGNGTNEVTLDGVTTAGTLSVVATNPCGSSAPVTLDISIAAPEICVLADCTRDSMFIDDQILDLLNATDVFQAIEVIESDATIQAGWFKIFRAGLAIDFYPPFTVEQGATFIAEIESCINNIQANEEKK